MILSRLFRTQGTYADYLRSPRWQRIRQRRLRWDRNRCVVCHGTERLQVHHASYKWRGQLWGVGEWLEFWDCVTLCGKHHRVVSAALRWLKNSTSTDE
jgi:5-methylcytosine-specific restriction endonuclease McrA